MPEARFLVPIGDLDPVEAAPLTDAGLTTYTAIKAALPVIWPGSTAVVIGIGGLGLYAVQFLRQLSGARVVAVVSKESRSKLASEYGAADVVSSGSDAADRIRELNRVHRGLDEPTDVLAFPIDRAESVAGPRELGDVVICREHAGDLREATVHGVLHLCGYDHETDDGAMLALQADLMREL